MTRWQERRCGECGEPDNPADPLGRCWDCGKEGLCGRCWERHDTAHNVEEDRLDREALLNPEDRLGV